MMSSMRSKIKSNARIVLKGNWPKAIIIILIIFFLWVALSSLEYAYAQAWGFPSDIDYTSSDLRASALLYARTTMVLSAIFVVIQFILTTPLLLGQTEWYWNLADRKPLGVEGVFAWFGSVRLFGKSLWLRLNIFLRILPWLLLTVGVPYAMVFVSLLFVDSANAVIAAFAILIMLFGEIFIIGGVFVLLFIATKYFLAPFLLVEDNKRSVNSCVKDSIRYTRGQQKDIFVFIVSFFGWFILCLLLVPLLYVAPYFSSASAIYAKFIIYSERLKDKNDNSNTAEYDANILKG